MHLEKKWNEPLFPKWDGTHDLFCQPVLSISHPFTCQVSYPELLQCSKIPLPLLLLIAE